MSSHPEESGFVFPVNHVFSHIIGSSSVEYVAQTYKIAYFSQLWRIIFIC